ncbi:MAG TPA: hypothetical protein DD714_06600 [Candidatus Omnitrophica bacterium]|nr:hypothetical protein [Candidatus Omnitrophota bacterium]
MVWFDAASPTRASSISGSGSSDPCHSCRGVTWLPPMINAPSGDKTRATSWYASCAVRVEKMLGTTTLFITASSTGRDRYRESRNTVPK